MRILEYIRFYLTLNEPGIQLNLKGGREGGLIRIVSGYNNVKLYIGVWDEIISTKKPS